jgi:hypothetical protein
VSRQVGVLDPEALKRQQDFAVLLAEGTKTSDAAKDLGIPLSTAFRWAKDPKVVEIVAQAQHEVRLRFVRRLFRLGEQALDVMEQSLTTGDVTPTQQKTADSVLDRIGVSREQIMKHIGSADEPIQVVLNAAVNPDARAEQEERRRRRAAREAEVVIEGQFEARG